MVKFKHWEVSRGFPGNYNAADRAYERVLHRLEMNHIYVYESNIRTEDDGQDNITYFVIGLPPSVTKTEIRKMLGVYDWMVEETE